MEPVALPGELWLSAVLAALPILIVFILLGQLRVTGHLVALAGAASPLGKMVAPQVLSAAIGAGGMSGTENRLLRIGLFHSLVLATLLAVMGYVWVTA